MRTRVTEDPGLRYGIATAIQEATEEAQRCAAMDSVDYYVIEWFNDLTRAANHPGNNLPLHTVEYAWCSIDDLHRLI